MKTRFVTGLFFATAVSIFAAERPLQHFITARNGQLFDGNKAFRFISLDVPNLLIVEDNVPFTEENPWRLPDPFEINDALETLQQLGGTVTRSYVITVVKTNDLPGTPRHVLAPGKFNEAAFPTLDQVLASATQTGVRLIIPFVDNWAWQGGRAEYAGWRGKTKEDFWTDPQLIADFKQTIHFILTRTNTITGIRYSEDKSILCWETGNEIDSPPAWTREIAHYIKSLDTNHLVMDGFNASVLRDESFEIPDVDIVTTHHYPGAKKSFAELIRANAGKAKGKKPYIVGEFGFVSTTQMADAMQAIMDTSCSGGMLWSLRFRNRDGGFYWHSEPGLGGNLYKAFHWPGSTIGNDYDEKNLLAIVRSNAFAIRGISVPPVAIPAPPRLLPVPDATAISWQGSVGATGYQVERARNHNGDWNIIATNVDEAFTQYRPQFADETVPEGDWFYRVRAKNESGVSGPSNIAGPVSVQGVTLVDELADFSKTHSKRGDWKTADRDCRSAKEDAHRTAGTAGAALIYQLPDEIQSFRVFAFFPKEVKELKCSISDDGQDFRNVSVQKEIYFHGAGEYGYWKPVLFHASNVGGGRFLKIELTGETQIGRVEISHPAPTQ
ncbi:MAG TPA: cellulase family glycosylhydrolase [Verrucomicrobiae bacterium]|nr:cellulase family glycosylhydrolase [Verrucomicrobiae bacterium]